MAFTRVTLTRHYELANDVPAQGKVRLTPSATLTNDGETIVPAPITADLDASGNLAIPNLAATTDPTTSPAAAVYLVREMIYGYGIRQYAVQVPHGAGSTVDLGDLAILARPAYVLPLFHLSDAADYDDTTDPELGQVLTWDGDNWVAADSTGGGSTADATTSTKGIARILGGTADAPTVPYTSVTGRPTLATVATSGSASDITTGTLPDGQIPSGIARDSEVTSAVSTHVGAADPHGDRAVAASALAAHEADTTAIHGITDTAALETTTGSAAKVSTHAAASDPHGDRAYTDTQVATRQPLDSDLTTIAGLTATTDSILQSKASAWTTRTPAQLKTDLALTKSDVGLGNVTNNAQVTGVTAGDATITIGGTSTAPTVAVTGSTYQPLDSDLTTIAGLAATTDNFLQSKSSAWASRTPTQVAADLVTPLSSSLQPLDADLTTIAGLTATTDNFLQAKSSAWASRTPAQAGADLASALLDARYGLAVHAVGNSGTSLTIDASSSSGPVKTITLTGNCTFTLTGATSGQATMLELVLTQDGTGSRTVTWPASVKWAGGAPTLSTAASSVDRVVLVSYNAGTTWYADLVGKGYA